MTDEQVRAEGQEETSAESEKSIGREKHVRTEEEKKTDRLIIKISAAVFITFVCCVLVFFLCFRYQAFVKVVKKIFKAAEPVIIGLVLAYLLNPVMKAVEGFFYKRLVVRMKREGRAKSISRGLGILGAILFLLLIIVLLAVAIIPAVIRSAMHLFDTVPTYVENFTDMLENGKLGEYEIVQRLGDYLNEITSDVWGWLQNTVLPQAQDYIVKIAGGIVSVGRTILNCIVGIFVLAYMLVIKEKLTSQGKKLIYAVLPARAGNVVLDLIRKADEIFGGFIIGKIIDSAIIGVIAYCGCRIMSIPDAILVAVIIGVTNIIPVFGPFIGAIPSVLLVVIQSPWHALYLAIFILVLQQIDGNLIGPKILGNSTGLSSFWVITAIIIGGGLFGVIGMILGVPVFGMCYYIVRQLSNRSLKKKGLPLETGRYLHVLSVDEDTHSLKFGRRVRKKRLPRRKRKKEKEENISQ
ncbi:MAG: AI-2E family transporter [Clostridiales bacterium]|nr:AI-2E family transporter [Clostridiales bacterium]